VSEPPSQPEYRLPASAVVAFYAVMGGGAALVGVFILGLDPFVPFPEIDRSPVTGLLLGAGVGLVTVVLSRVMDRFFEWSRALTRMFREVLGALTPSDTLVLAVASSLGEEILFRGVLLPELGLVASSLIFGLAHGVAPGQPAEMWSTLRRLLPLVIAAVVMGFAFGLAVEYTGNILAAVVAHFTINYLNLNQMYRSDWQTPPRGNPDG
jgi:membrane protease YdiL (CAAX protease family)